MAKKRYDKHRRLLKKGESQRKDGKYDYRWTDKYGYRHAIYADTLDELREKEVEIIVDDLDDIMFETKRMTVNELHLRWRKVKRGIRDSTLSNYDIFYNTHVSPVLGKKRVSDVKKTDIKAFYNYLNEKVGLSISSIGIVNNVLMQMFSLAIEDGIIRKDPTHKAYSELRKLKKDQIQPKKSLTVEEQRVFIEYLEKAYNHTQWYHLFIILMGTGMRIGEALGLRWCDIDFQDNFISVNHILSYHVDPVTKVHSNHIHLPKTLAGIREIPMFDFVRDAFLNQKKLLIEEGITCNDECDGFTDFIFLSCNGKVLNSAYIDVILKRIVDAYNRKDYLISEEGVPLFLPHISCHIFRHTFATRLCELDANIKFIQNVMGHNNSNITMDIYVDATSYLRQKEITNLSQTFSAVHLLGLSTPNNTPNKTNDMCTYKEIH